MKPMIFHANAEAEYTTAVAEYADIRSELAARFRAEVVAALRKIRRSPEIHAFDFGTDCRRVLLRKFPYKVVYHDEGHRYLIVAVSHTSRDPGYWAERLNGSS